MTSKIVKYKKYCKHCDYKCLRSKDHFICELCFSIDNDICNYRQPFCSHCLDIIKRFEEFLNKYGKLIVV